MALCRRGEGSGRQRNFVSNSPRRGEPSNCLELRRSSREVVKTTRIWSSAPEKKPQVSQREGGPPPRFGKMRI